MEIYAINLDISFIPVKFLMKNASGFLFFNTQLKKRLQCEFELRGRTLISTISRTTPNDVKLENVKVIQCNVEIVGRAFVGVQLRFVEKLAFPRCVYMAVAQRQMKL